LDGEGDTIQVQFPNSEVVNLPLATVFVRWRRPIDDPAAYLAKLITETPLFAVNRSKFLRSIVWQRAASIGITAAMSATIELQPHQLEVARRVLHDPVQRYLLADEVGLGKTIEAGIIIRQYFLDSPLDATVVVIVPDALTDQWRQELGTRLALKGHLAEGTLQVISYQSSEAIEAALDEAGMLVIDEAHHLTRSTPHEVEIYELVRKKVAEIPRLLLLSATPVLGNEAAFLKMLHLLDPVTYPLEGFEFFRRRIEARQQIAETVAALVPENALVLDSYLDNLITRFNDDPVVRDSVSALRSILERLPSPEDEALVLALERLRSHVSDTYRLDRRILRHRRRQLPLLTPRRAGSRVWAYRDPATLQYVRAIDNLRVSLVNALPPGENSQLDVVTSLLLAALQGPLAVRHWADSIPAATATGLETQLEVVKSLAASVSASEARLICLYNSLRVVLERPVKVVIFCSSPDVADAVYAFLRARIPRDVARHKRMAVRDKEPWQRFLQPDGFRVLVCDASAEEGLNLQGGAKILVHYDLPLAPNRIEQRLGRVDRYGAGSAIESFIVLCDDNEFETEWYRCLAHGFGVFSRSIASLQYLVDDAMGDLMGRLVGEGAGAIDSVIESLAGPGGRVQSEFRRLDAQDDLDALSQEVGNPWEPMLDLDADWQALRDAMEPWVRESLIFTSERVALQAVLPEGDYVCRYRFNYGSSRPTLVSATEFISQFADAMDRTAPHFRAQSPVTYPYSYRRNTALLAAGQRLGVRLLRSGDAFVNGLEEFTHRDDRGRIYAFWRTAPGYESASPARADLFFHIDLILEADLRQGEALVRERTGDPTGATPALRRRAESFLPPMMVSVWLDSTMREVDAQFVERWLRWPYNKYNNSLSGVDRNLRTTRWDYVIGRQLPDMPLWSELPIRAVSVAKSIALNAPETRRSLQRAASAAREAWERRSLQYRLRLSWQTGFQRESEMRSAEHELQLALALISGIEQPVNRIDSIGAVFLSNESLAPERVEPS
jgi:ATP-dependent helicase HepA